MNIPLQHHILCRSIARDIELALNLLWNSRMHLLKLCVKSTYKKFH